MASPCTFVTAAAPLRLRPRALPRQCGTRAALDDANGDVTGRDWREFRAALVAGSAEALARRKEGAYRAGHWAHPLATLEEGCFLCSHPAYYRRAAPYLTQSVVFITMCGPRGATGLVLNRPLRGDVAELERDGMFGRSSQLAATPMAKQPVYVGGPDLIESGVMNIVHPCADLNAEDSREPLAGVFVGALPQFVERVKRGESKPTDARLFAGCLRWGAGELEKEIDEGSWYCAAASPLFALKHCLQLPKPLWVELMQTMGQPFAQIASQVYEENEENAEQ